MNNSLIRISLLIGLFFISNQVKPQVISEDSLLARHRAAEAMSELDQMKYYYLVKENISELQKGKFTEQTKAKIYLSASNVYNGNTDYSTAIEYVLKAIKIFNDLDDHESLSKAYNYLGGIYYNAYNYERCIYFTNKSIEIALQYNSNERLPILYNNLAGAYLKLNDYEKALEISFQALKYTKIYSKDQASVIFGTMGEIHSAQKNYDSASFYLNKALKLIELQGDRSNLQKVGLMLSLSQNQFYRGEYDSALESSSKTYKLSNKSNFIVFKKDAAAVLADIYEIKNFPDSVNYYRSIFIELADSVYNLDKERQLSNVMIQARELEL
ncbi:MAG: tetratricopeptide repeat protein, partial [Nitrososphaeraceae archaeon]|nr:tetratricopeptide repeat protein [Nitrososphaeraceae archaeon]